MLIRHFSVWVGVVLLTCNVFAAAPAPVPVKDLFRTYNYLFPWMSMSPDGTSVASVFYSEWEERHFPALASINLETKESKILHLNRRILVRDIDWIGANRLLMTAWGLNSAENWRPQMGLFAFDASGGRTAVIVKPGDPRLSSALLGTVEVRNPTGDWTEVSPPSVISWKDTVTDEVLIAQSKRGDRYEKARRWANDGAAPLAGVYRLNTVTGKYALQTADPGWTYQWFADPAGKVRIASGSDSKQFTAEGRPVDPKLERAQKLFWFSDQGQPEEVTAINLGVEEEFDPLGFEQGGRRFLFSGRQGRDRAAVYAYDPVAKTVSEPLVENPNVEIDTAILSPHDQTVAGVRVDDGLPRIVWLDAQLKKLQVSVDAALPGCFNRIQQWTEDYQRVLILSASPKEPGRYMVLDRKKGTMVELFERAPWLVSAKFGETQAITFKARDGVQLHGYLTRPPDAAKNARTPLVLMVHGGPWTIRDYGQFDPEVQFYATRGYAVLQVNFRMSAGYGRQLEDLGRKQLGRTMQTDLDDGVEWAIAQGIADPKCLLIAGGSYGGYATLMGLIQNPSRFRAGIAMFPLTDLMQQLTDYQDDAKRYPRDDWRAYNIEHFKKHAGDPAVERAEMEAYSPNNHVAKIQAPVFLVYGPEDEVVDKRQVRKFIEQMKMHKKKIVHFAPREEAHGINNEKRRLKVYTELEKFLAEYVPAH